MKTELMTNLKTALKPHPARIDNVLAVIAMAVAFGFVGYGAFAVTFAPLAA